MSVFVKKLVEKASLKKVNFSDQLILNFLVYAFLLYILNSVLVVFLLCIWERVCIFNASCHFII